MVVSDVHSRETSAIPDAYNKSRRELWQFQNNLADGCITVDWEDIFITQWKRILTNRDNDIFFPPSDLGLDNVHQLCVGMHVQSTNRWRQNIHQREGSSKGANNEVIHNAFELRLKNIPNCKDSNDCLSYVRGLWVEEIQQGIVSCRQRRNLHLEMEYIIKEFEAGRTPSLPTLPETASLHHLVNEVAQGPEEEILLSRWQKLLGEDSVRMSAFMRIRTAFEAELLWRWKTVRNDCVTNKFDRKFGMSRQNDLDHISIFAPYVDVLTTDNSMRNLCETNIVANELTQFPCKIFSKNNYDEFEKWLDMLILEPVTQGASLD